MKHLTNKNAVHLAMFIFGGYSAMNIATFFVSIGHPAIVGWALGIALGIGLIAASIYLSKQDINDRLPFFLLLGAVVMVAILSGQIQYLSYLRHPETAPYAIFLGFAPPFIVELVLALSVSFAEKAERNRQLRNSDESIEDNILSVMVGVSTEFDTANIKSDMQAKMEDVYKAKMDVLITRLMPKIVNVTPQPNAVIPYQVAQKQARIREFAYHLADNYNGVETNVLNLNVLAEHFKVSPKTIKRWIAELTTADLLNGHVDAKLMKSL